MTRTWYATVLCAGITVAAASPSLAADAVVGSGTPASCTEGALDSAVATVVPGGGTITFNCGGAATINLTTQKVFFYAPNPALTYTIDGGGLITLNGSGVTRHIFHLSGTLNVRNITFTGGRAVGTADDASGAAIRSDRDVAWVPNPTMALNLTNVMFTNNATTLTGWSAPYSQFDYGGGAVFARLIYLTVANSTFSGNTANNSAGGAIHGRSSTITLYGSVFQSNVSNGGGFGGAIHADGLSAAGSNGTMTIAASRFSGNTALSQGGAIYFFLHPGLNESVTLDTVSVTDNHVIDSGIIPFVGNRGIGGGLAGDGGNVSIRNSTFANNSARGQTSTGGGGAGGGISLFQNGAVTITNSTLSGNQAIGNNSDASGGGLLIWSNTQPFQVIHSTIAYNQAGWTGGGIQSQTTGVLVNTVVAHNTAATPFGTIIQQQCAAQLINGGGAYQYPDIVGAPNELNPRCANGVVVTNPQILGLSSNGGLSQTHHPAVGSPLVGTATCEVATDQRGVTRPQGAGCEIGSVEVLGSPAASMNVEAPLNGVVAISPLAISGWALDPSVGPNAGPGVNLVAVYAGSSCSGSPLAQVAPGLSRPDVRAAFGLDSSYTGSGYSLSVAAPPGAFTFTVCARSAFNNQFMASVTRSVVISSPLMNVDVPGQSAGVARTFSVAGWAFDRGAAVGPGVNLVRIFLGTGCSGSVLADATLGIARPDVRTAFGLSASFGNTGFSANATVPSGGTQQITVCARSTLTGSFATQITRTVIVSDALMNIDTPTFGGGVLAPFVVGGWALDRGAATGPGVDLVRVFQGSACAGTVLANATLGLARPDVRAAYGLPASFNNSGFSASVTPTGIGGQVFTACARSTATGQFAVQATWFVIVSNTFMNVDAPGAGAAVATTFSVSGWAFDNGAGGAGPGVDLVRVFQGSACSGTILASAATLGVSRPDVQVAFGLPASYANTGYQANVTVSPGSLTFSVCVRSAVTGTFTRGITRSVTVN